MVLACTNSESIFETADIRTCNIECDQFGSATSMEFVMSIYNNNMTQSRDIGMDIQLPIGI